MLNRKENIKVIVADDSAFMRRVISDIINADSSMKVIATARNGEDVYEKLKEIKPDVLILDIEMPKMDGLKALEKIMKYIPLPVIMFSALTHDGAGTTIKALEMGAVDFITKPGGSITNIGDELAREIRDKVKTAASVPVPKINGTKAIPRSEMVAKDKIDIKKTARQATKHGNLKLVCIGTSTGGPKALHTVMSAISFFPDVSIFIVQHMPPGFTKSLAQRLDMVSGFKVKEAVEGEVVEGGVAYVAPGDYHMEISSKTENLEVCLTQSPPINGHRPSVEVLMKSAAKLDYPTIAVIMTGMGSDGAVGIKALKEAGAVTIGESSETCVVYGMPKAAYKLGVIDHEVPLYQIAEYIEHALISVGRR